MPCKNAQSTTPTLSVCGLGLYGGRPSHGTCVKCERNTDRQWHEKQVAVMLTVSARPVAKISAEPIKPSSDIGGKLHAILSNYGITEAAGCSCKATAGRLNSMTKDQVAENLQQLAQELAQRLKNMPQVAEKAHWWVRVGIGMALADPTQLVAIEAAKRLIRKAME